jgi:hypothetical protein
MNGIVAIALIVALFILLMLATVAWIPNWFEQRKQARLDPESRVRRQRYNNIMEWPRNHYNATLDLQDEVRELRAQVEGLQARLAEREPRLGR